MDPTLKMMMLGLAIIVVCHAASINVTRNGDQGKNVNLRILTSLTLGNVDLKSGLHLATSVELKKTGLDSGTNEDLKTTGLDKNCSLGKTGLDLGTNGHPASCSHPFKKVGRKCYYFGGESVTFSEAGKRCFKVGGILASPVNSIADNIELHNAMSKAQNIKPGAGEPWYYGGYWV